MIPVVKSEPTLAKVAHPDMLDKRKTWMKEIVEMAQSDLKFSPGLLRHLHRHPRLRSR